MRQGFIVTDVAAVIVAGGPLRGMPSASQISAVAPCVTAFIHSSRPTLRLLGADRCLRQAPVGRRWPIASISAGRILRSAIASAGISICNRLMEHLMSTPGCSRDDMSGFWIRRGQCSGKRAEGSILLRSGPLRSHCRLSGRQILRSTSLTRTSATGLEPATTGSTVRYSNQLSYAPGEPYIFYSAGTHCQASSKIRDSKRMSPNLAATSSNIDFSGGPEDGMLVVGPAGKG